MFPNKYIHYSYLFFPLKNYFNYEGRVYIFNILKTVLFNTWLPIFFKENFVVSNIESLRTPI